MAASLVKLLTFSITDTGKFERSGVLIGTSGGPALTLGLVVRNFMISTCSHLFNQDGGGNFDDNDIKLAQVFKQTGSD